jgi:glycosyltransferase involved in cell wall biosynthesis
MLRLTGLIHTHNHGLTLGRTLESLRPCDQLLIVDHGSRDDTLRVAREYGANLLLAASANADQVLRAASSDWILSILPTEALTEALEASLFEWKLGDARPASTFAVEVREAREGTGHPVGVATRLVNRTAVTWRDALPPSQDDAILLDGVLLRFPGA